MISDRDRGNSYNSRIASFLKKNNSDQITAKGYAFIFFGKKMRLERKGVTMPNFNQFHLLIPIPKEPEIRFIREEN